MKHIKIFEEFNFGLNNLYARPDQPGAYPRTIPSGEMESGFILLSGSDNGFNISHVGNENELRELTSKLKSISYVDVYPPIKDNGEKLAYTYDGDDFRQCKSPKDVDYEFFINEDGEIIEDAGNGEGYLWEIPEIGFTLVGQPGGFFSKVSNSQFANKL
jgi:hypothetical protein